MATSQQWRNASLLVAATLVVLFIGTADAWASCPSGYKNCDHKPGCETNIKTDVYNCGDCGKKCKHVAYATAKCQHGYCDYTCKAGWSNCDKSWHNGCETDTGKDVKSCGGCGKPCKEVPYAIAKCHGGQCQYTCKAGWADCDKKWHNGCEKDVGKDIHNCGGCGKKCPLTLKGGEATCSNGKCGEQCKKGWKYDKVKKCCVPGY